MSRKNRYENEQERQTNHPTVSHFESSDRSRYGVTPSLDAAPSFFPSTVTLRAFTFLIPLLAREPSRLTTMPTFNVFRVQPCLCRPLGLPISQTQFAILPVASSFTST